MKRAGTHLLLAFLLASANRPGLRSDEPAVSLRIPPLSGEPGQEVAVEFRANVSRAVVVFLINFDLSKEAADFIRADISGTACAHAAPRGIIYNPRFFKGGYQIGVRFDTQSPYGRMEAGEDLLLVKAVFRVRADAPPGGYPLHLKSADFSGEGAKALPFSLGGDGTFRVDPPRGPRPVGDLACSQNGDRVTLSWLLTETYDSITIRRSDGLAASVSGADVSWSDHPLPGPVSYQVAGVLEGKESLPARCGLAVQAPRPEAIRDLACAAGEGVVSLHWTSRLSPLDQRRALRRHRPLPERSGPG